MFYSIRFSVLPKEEQQCYENDYIKNYNNEIIFFYLNDLKFIYSSKLLDNIADNISGCEISEISYKLIENEVTFSCREEKSIYTSLNYTKKIENNTYACTVASSYLFEKPTYIDCKEFFVVDSIIEKLKDELMNYFDKANVDMNIIRNFHNGIDE